MDFEAMPNGTWIVRSWRIRMPLARPATSPLTGKDLAVLAGIEVEGGDVIRVHENDGTIAILESGPRGRIAGSVLDTYVESYGYAPEPVEVEVADAGSPAEVDFSTPSVPWLVNHICRDEKRPDPLRIAGAEFPMEGFLTGQVTDADGNPVPEANVRILWTRYALDETEDQTRIEARRAFSMPKTNASGHYIACWVPVDTTLEVAVVEAGHNAAVTDIDANELRTGRHLVVVSEPERPERLDLRLGVGDSALPP